MCRLNRNRRNQQQKEQHKAQVSISLILDTRHEHDSMLLQTTASGSRKENYAIMAGNFDVSFLKNLNRLHLIQIKIKNR
jgi:hypothetical protein